MKRIRTIFKTIIIIILVLGFWGYRQYTELRKWGEFDSLVKLWPQLQKEHIRGISFFVEANPDIGENNIVFEVPEEDLQEFITILDEKMRKVKPTPAWHGMIVCSNLGSMSVVTEKRQYTFDVHAHIGGTTRSYVHGKQWTCYELGDFLYNIGFPAKEYKYELPPRKEIETIIIAPRRRFIYPPIAVFGDVNLLDKVLWVDKGAAEEEAGKPLEPKKIFEGRDWIEKIMTAYEDALKQAGDRDKGEIRPYYPADINRFNGKILFITRYEYKANTLYYSSEKESYYENYGKGIGIRGNVIYDDYIQSEQLKKYFDELGLTEELLAREPNVAQ